MNSMSLEKGNIANWSYTASISFKGCPFPWLFNYLTNFSYIFSSIFLNLSSQAPDNWFSDRYNFGIIGYGW